MPGMQSHLGSLEALGKRKPASEYKQRETRSKVSYGYCKTCDEMFEKTHHSKKYCCDDHNPTFLSMEERRELIKQYGPRECFYRS